LKGRYALLNYLWLDDHTPILTQLPNNFRSAAILLHPFVQMPSGWEQTKHQDQDDHLYPSSEEILTYGKPVSWKNIMQDSHLRTPKELAVALKTSISALKQEYSRSDLADQLNSSLKADLYYPTEDSTSVFLIGGLLKVLGSKGAENLYYSDPILDHNGLLSINDTTVLDICELTSNELLVTDENMEFAFMSVYDSFITLLLMKDANIDEMVQSLDVEAILCDKHTYIDWYF
jgi:hypothetical protein